MIIILFGLPGAGKNFIGEIIAAHFGFHFFDGDAVLSPEMQACIANKQVFTQPMRDQFMESIIQSVNKMQSQYKNIVVAQALFKEKNRMQLAKAFPEAIFILIEASFSDISSRLIKRNNQVDQEYADKIHSQFEKPKLSHQIIVNNSDQASVITKCRAILRI